MIGKIISTIAMILLGIALLGIALYALFSDIEKTYNRWTFPMTFFLVVFIISIILLFIGGFMYEN